MVTQTVLDREKSVKSDNLKRVEQRSLFREKSVERLASPERLDQIMRVIEPKSWIPLVSLGGLLSAAIIWGICGRIPVMVEGRGIIIHPSKVVSLQSKGAGQLLDLKIKVGDTIKKGQIIAKIDQTELKKQLQQQQLKLSELQAQDRAVGLLQGRGIIEEKKTIEQQRQNALRRIQKLQSLIIDFQQKNALSLKTQRIQLKQRIAELTSLAPILRQKSQESLKEQAKSLQHRIRLAQAQLPVLQIRVKKRQSLFRDGVITQDVSLQAEQEYIKKQEEITLLENQLIELGVKENDARERYINITNEIATNQAGLQRLELEATNAKEAYFNNLSEIAKSQADLRDLDNRSANFAKQNLQDTTIRNNQIQEVRREIAKLESQLQNNSEIISQHTGRILELAVIPGQVITTGTRLGTIDTEDLSKKLVSVAYFPVGDGKKIQSGMTIQMTPQTVKRERFGGIVGRVSGISQFPISKEAAAAEIGNADVVASLVPQKQEGAIQVFANLELDVANPSGYKWSSSKGPETTISAGTTTSVRVKVEERTPIAFVLPILREYTGIY
jgi:HlyD family secretion protein